MLNTRLKIAAPSVQLMAIKEIDLEEERLTRLKKKKKKKTKDTLGMGEPMEVLTANAASSSGARSSA